MEPLRAGETPPDDPLAPAEMELDLRCALPLPLLPLAKAPMLGRRLGALCSWKELVLLLLVSGTPPPAPDPLSLLLRLPEELAFWKRCLLDDVPETEAAAVAFLEAGPLLTPGFSPVCCFFMEPEDPAKLVAPLLLPFAFTWLAEEELEPEPEFLLLPVLLMVNLRPSWLLGFTMYSVEAPAGVLPPAESLLAPLVAKQLLVAATPGCCCCCSIVAVASVAAAVAAATAVP